MKVRCLKERALNLIFHIFRLSIVILVSIVDVKVKADVTVSAVSGNVEVERSGIISEATPGQKATEPVFFETLDSSSQAKVLFFTNYFGIGGSTHLFFDSPGKVDFLRGSVFVKAPRTLTLKTNHCDILTNKAEFVAEVWAHETKVSVTAGSLDMIDRASGRSYSVKEGYQLSIGGLLPNGKREVGDLEPFSLDGTLKYLSVLGFYSAKDLQAQYDRLRPLWNTAIEATASRHQSEISKDLSHLWVFEKRQEHQQWLRHLEEVKMKKYFREKTLGVPSENKEDPSESLRVPASAD